MESENSARLIDRGKHSETVLDFLSPRPWALVPQLAKKWPLDSCRKVNDAEVVVKLPCRIVWYCVGEPAYPNNPRSMFIACLGLPIISLHSCSPETMSQSSFAKFSLFLDNTRLSARGVLDHHQHFRRSSMSARGSPGLHILLAPGYH
jgi:hypothetical protein